MRFVELVPALRPALAAQRLTPHARDVRRGVGVGVQAGGARRARGGAARGGGAGGLHGSPRSWRSSTPTPPSTSTHRSTTAEETIVEAASQDIICFKQVAGSIPSQAGVRARARRRHRPAERGGRGGGWSAWTRRRQRLQDKPRLAAQAKARSWTEDANAEALAALVTAAIKGALSRQLLGCVCFRNLV